MTPSRVLVVDDCVPFIRILSSILPSDSFEIVGQATDGLEALKEVAALQPDLILLDIGLPKLNGIEVARAVKRLAPRAAIVMVSQDSSRDLVEAALDAGAHGYVHKLRSYHELLPAIESVLAGRRFVTDEPSNPASGNRFALAH